MLTDRIFNTIKHLKFTQVYHQIWYRLKRKLWSNPKYKPYRENGSIRWQNYIQWNTQWLGNKKFSFLNITHVFNDQIDWNISEYGKLWTYNLNYFDWLSQKSITRIDGLNVIKKYVKDRELLQDGLEPYPTSLRIINWVKFLGGNNIDDKPINEFLYNDAVRLSSNLEYHLLANHLLENAFALTFAGIFFADESIRTKGLNLLRKQLEEQILGDGAHYELSPMYHQLMLYRVLDTIQLLRNNPISSNDLTLNLLEKKASIMLGWINQIVFSNGDIPLVNDSAFNISPSIESLNEYACQLGIRIIKNKLNSSGFRKFVTEEIECFIDVGNIIPAYQPAHVHADTLQFLIYLNAKPFLAEMGTSTYDRGERRELERASKSHNVVTLDGLSSSDVWSAHRVGRRAVVNIHEDSENEICASHNGFGTDHKRSWSLGNKMLSIVDSVHQTHCVAHFHFHENYSDCTFEGNVIMWSDVKIEFIGANEIIQVNYLRAESWNELIPCMKFEVNFYETLETKISWSNGGEE